MIFTEEHPIMAFLCNDIIESYQLLNVCPASHLTNESAKHLNFLHQIQYLQQPSKGGDITPVL